MPKEQALYSAVESIHGEQIFLTDAAGRSLSYGGLCALVAHFESSFDALGLQPGDVVAIIVPEGPTAISAIIASLMVSVAAPLNPALAASEIRALLRRIRPRAVVVSSTTDQQLLQTIDELGLPALSVSPFPQIALRAMESPSREAGRAEAVRLVDVPGVLLPTSGTSGDPKLVYLSESRLLYAASGIGEVLQLTGNDCTLCILPCFHIHGLSTVLATLLTGGSVVCVGPFSTDCFASVSGSQKISWFSATPTHFKALLTAVGNIDVSRNFSALRLLRSASAPLSEELLLQIEKVFSVPVIQAYGMTEAGPQIASNGLARAQRKPGSVGRPVGTEVSIVAMESYFADSEKIGEIAIRGASVIQEYFSATEDEAGAFISGWLHTGDLGYLDDEGYLYLTGRKDELINSGGEKIAPQQIESVLSNHPAVRNVAVYPVPHDALGEVAHAAVVLREGFLLADDQLDDALALDRILRRYCLSQMAAFKVPQRFTFLESIPVQDNKKLQRRKLYPLIEAQTRADSGRANSEPLDLELHRAVTAAWSEVLGTSDFGAHDNFFVYGGDSLTATMAISRLARDLRVDLPVDSFFLYPTVAQQVGLLSQLLGQDVSTSADSIKAPPANDAGQILPLSRGQLRLWFLDQAGAGSEYNMSQPMWLRGPVDTEILSGALDALCNRHSALRTTINVLDGHPVQRIHPVGHTDLRVIDLSELSPEAARERALGMAGEFRNELFDLSAGPLFRSVLVKLDVNCHLLLITIHHIVCDGWSMQILRRDLDLLYRAISSGAVPELIPAVAQFADYVNRELLDELNRGGRKQELLRWWSQELDEVDPVIRLPHIKEQTDGRTKAGARLHFEISSAAYSELEAVARRLGATVYSLFAASLAILMHSLSGQQQFCLGTVSANRSDADLEQVVGFLARTLPLPVKISTTDRVETVVDRVAQKVRGVLAHSAVEFDELVRVSGVTRYSDTTPLFQVMLAFQNLPHVLDPGVLDSPAGEVAGIEMETFVVDGDSAKFDLSLYLRPTNGAVKGIWQYRSDKFDAQVIERMRENFLSVLHAVVHSSHMTVAELPLEDVTNPEPLEGSTLGKAACCPPLLPELFKRQVDAGPQRTAVSSASGLATYAELSERVNRLAGFLSQQLKAPEPVVAVLLPRDECLVVASLAVMSTAATLMPMEPAYPELRLREMLARAAVDLIIVNRDTRDILSKLAPGQDLLAQVLCLDEQAAAIKECLPVSPGKLPSPNDAAYVVFTSGSMGKPKGTVISQRNLAHYIEAMSHELKMVDTDNYLFTASCAFSASVRQFSLPLANGGRVVIAEKHQIENIGTLMDIVSHERVTVLDLVPTLWQACLRWLSLANDYSEEAFAQLRLLLSASEPLPTPLAKELREYWSHAQLLNMYGQTETTGIVAINRGCGEGSDANIVPLGKPIRGTRIVMLDTNGRLAPPDTVGEICVGSPCVGQGYLGEAGPEPLATVNVKLPGQSSQVFYRTGDLGRYREDGNIEFCGRRDTQIKHHGSRIEPGEIEVVAQTHPAVTEAVVFLAQRDSPAGTQELQMAYSVARNDGQKVEEGQLRHHLQAQLPEHMVPTRFLQLPALPRTPVGKLDRTAVVEAAAGVSASGIPAVLKTASMDSVDNKDKISATTKTLLTIWKNVLGYDAVEPHANFFDLGGNSILSIEVVAQAMDAGLELNLEQLFRFQTIAELAPAVVAGESQAAQRQIREMTSRGEPAISEPTDHTRYSAGSLRTFSLEALERSGLSQAGARILTEVQLESSLRGQVTHNIGDIPRYAKRLASGALNPSPNMKVTDTSAISATVDGDNAPGQWVATVAIEKAIALAGASGAGFVSVKRSNHFGAAGHYVWRASQAGMIGLCFTNGPVMLAPTGGVTPLFGNNPIAIGLPLGDSDPVMLDIAMSAATRGKIGLTLAEGEPLQPGWILDELGLPSTQLEDLAAGLAVPIGGHKGYGLAFAIEALAGVLSGASYCRDHAREAVANGGELDVGHFFIALDPELFIARDQYEARLTDMVQQTRSSELARGSCGIFVPGELELRARRYNLRHGIPLADSVARRLVDYGKLHKLRATIQRC